MVVCMGAASACDHAIAWTERMEPLDREIATMRMTVACMVIAIGIGVFVGELLSRNSAATAQTPSPRALRYTITPFTIGPGQIKNFNSQPISIPVISTTKVHVYLGSGSMQEGNGGTDLTLIDARYYVQWWDNVGITGADTIDMALPLDSNTYNIWIRGPTGLGWRLDRELDVYATDVAGLLRGPAAKINFFSHVALANGDRSASHSGILNFTIVYDVSN
jgi:hypothetical protein